MIGKFEQAITAVELTIPDLEEKSLINPERETLAHLDRFAYFQISNTLKTKTIEGRFQNGTHDPTEINKVADQHPEILQKLATAYDTYAKDVGVVIPRGQAFYESLASASPSINQSQVTITSADITPANFTQMDNSLQ
jgi:hypothetical protein